MERNTPTAATTPPAPAPRPERDVPRKEVPDEREPDAPNDEGDVEISRRAHRSYVGEAGTSSKG